MLCRQERLDNSFKKISVDIVLQKKMVCDLVQFLGLFMQEVAPEEASKDGSVQVAGVIVRGPRGLLVPLSRTGNPRQNLRGFHARRRA